MSNLIEKKLKSTNKKNTVLLFGEESQENNNNNERNNFDDDEDDDFIIQGNVKDAKDVVNQKQTNMDLDKGIWEENDEEIVYVENIEDKPKKVGWGDNVKKTGGRANFNMEEEYFPDLNDKNAKKSKPKGNSTKPINAGLFSKNESNTFQGLSVNRDTGNSKIVFQDGPSRFSNSKGNSNLSKFMDHNLLQENVHEE